MSDRLATMLEAVMAENEWIPADLARQSGVDAGTISRILGGETGPIKPPTATKLSRATGLTVEAIIAANTDDLRDRQVAAATLGVSGGDAEQESFRHRRRRRPRRRVSVSRLPVSPDAGAVRLAAEAAKGGAGRGAGPDRDVELGPAGFVTRAEFDRMYSLLTRVAKRVGVTVVAAMCAIGLAKSASAEVAIGGAGATRPVSSLSECLFSDARRLLAWLARVFQSVSYGTYACPA